VLDRAFLLLNIPPGVDWQDDTEVPGWLVDQHVFGLGDTVTLRNSILGDMLFLSMHWSSSQFLSHLPLRPLHYDRRTHHESGAGSIIGASRPLRPLAWVWPQYPADFLLRD
jgi:hypothetical protein